jgi:hypothetical protein
VARIDDYERRRRELDLIFQELEDREVAAHKSEWLSKLEAYGTSQRDVNSIRRELLKVAQRKGKTETEAELYADRVLQRLLALMEKD